MKTTCYNDSQLWKIFDYANQELLKKGAINISVDEYTKGTTKKQIGFWFGALSSAVRDFYEKEHGISMSDDTVKELFYKKLSPRQYVVGFNGLIEEVILRISNMSREQMAKFIDDSIRFIDTSEEFNGLVLHPSVRYCWVHNITPSDIREIDESSFPRHSPEYLEATRKENCLLCGVFGCEAHHIREAEEAGTARKADDWEVIPLCPTCHSKYHLMGKKWFNAKMHWITKYMTLRDFCAVKYNRWLNHF